MHKLLTIVMILALGGCAAPQEQEQVLKKLPSTSPAKAGSLVNCNTDHRFNGGSTICH